MTYKYVCYRPEYNAKGGSHWTEFRRPWNAKKNFLVILFTPRVIIVNKMLKIDSIFVSSADGSNKSVTVWGTSLSASERFYLALSKNVTDYWILSYY